MYVINSPPPLIIVSIESIGSPNINATNAQPITEG